MPSWISSARATLLAIVKLHLMNVITPSNDDDLHVKIPIIMAYVGKVFSIFVIVHIYPFARHLLFAERLELRHTTYCTDIPSWSCSQAVSKPVWHIPLFSVQWKTPDDGHSNRPKRVEFYSKNKYEKLVHIVGFIIRI